MLFPFSSSVSLSIAFGNISSWISEPSRTKSLCVSFLWDSQAAWGLVLDLERSGYCSMFVRIPKLLYQMLLFSGFLVKRSASSRSSYHLLSPILVTFLQFYCCSSGFLGSPSSWPCTPAGFELVVAVKPFLKVGCWLAATFCWMRVWRFSFCWHHCANVLPSLESLYLFSLQMLCWFPLPTSSRSFGT